MEQEYLISDILTAMEHQELKVFYQPKYDTTTCCAETSVCWRKISWRYSLQLRRSSCCWMRSAHGIR